MWESQVDGTGLTQAIDLVRRQCKVQTSQVILQLLLAARTEYGDRMVGLLPHPVDRDLRRSMSRFRGKTHQHGSNIFDPLTGVF